jgi:hypothetical protein
MLPIIPLQRNPWAVFDWQTLSSRPRQTVFEKKQKKGENRLHFFLKLIYYALSRF